MWTNSVIGCISAVLLAAGCGISNPHRSRGTGGSDTSYPSGGPIASRPGAAGPGGIDPLNPGGNPSDGGFPVVNGVYTEPLVLADRPPPPIAGGTLLLAARGQRAFVADPDRDQVIVADLAAMSVAAAIPLHAGDEPGRLAEDGQGRVHVVLRRAGAIATLDTAAGVELERTSVCSQPRGIAYDAQADAIHVACAGGELITLAASGGAPTRTLRLDRDLRDVVVDGDRLFVSRFRAAELLVVERTGEVSSRWSPIERPTTVPTESSASAATPALAFRIVAAPGGGVLVAFQMDQVSPVVPMHGGYGSRCRHIVNTTVSLVRQGGLAWSAQNIDAVLPVDVAASPDGKVVAVASAGTTPLVFSQPLSVTKFAMPSEGGSFKFSAGCGWGGPPLAFDPDPTPSGRVVALAFDANQELVVQTREPSMLLVGSRGIPLPGESRKDTGHELFHFATAAGIACASCHAEGQEDGHVWTFVGMGPRRTQAISGGFLGTEPLHWNGDMQDFEALAHDVFNGRMSGPALSPAHLSALARWMDAVPRLSGGPPADPGSAERGRAIFNDTAVGCAGCHTGDKLTNNSTVDVNTGGKFQTPSLVGVSWRAPYMHDGCAATLTARFGSCGGGDVHGRTSMLSAPQVADLVSYLETL